MTLFRGLFYRGSLNPFTRVVFTRSDGVTLTLLSVLVIFALSRGVTPK